MQPLKRGEKEDSFCLDLIGLEIGSERDGVQRLVLRAQLSGILNPMQLDMKDDVSNTPVPEIMTPIFLWTISLLPIVKAILKMKF